MNTLRNGRWSSLAVFAPIAVLVAVTISSSAFSEAQDKNAQVQLMFVQSAENLKVDAAAKTMRLVKVNQQTLYFSDRPDRIAGHMTMADYLKEWTAKAGKDNFGKNPPNAALSVYEPGQKDSTLVAVEITNPVVDGADLVYNYKIIEGKMPAAGGATSLFIDWFAAARGGAVGGFAYRGVAVGGRGFGRR